MRNKRILSIITSASLTAAMLLTGCQITIRVPESTPSQKEESTKERTTTAPKEEDTKERTTTTPKETEAEEDSTTSAEAEPGFGEPGTTASDHYESEPSIPKPDTSGNNTNIGNPLVYLGFEDERGLTAVTQTLGNSNTYNIEPSGHSVMIAEGQGAVGNALYLDGTYGVAFDMLPLPEDRYTISFWYNADRFVTFGPIVQMGRNIDGSNKNAAVTWLTFTMTNWSHTWEAVAPIVWNRNSSIGTQVSPDGVWPYIGGDDDQVHGRKEWSMVTLVVDGNRYVSASDDMERVGARLYVDGELISEASAENSDFFGVAPEIFAGRDIEAYIGINYWDSTFKGFIDELYIYDKPLSAEEVQELYRIGDPPYSPVAPH